MPKELDRGIDRRIDHRAWAAALVKEAGDGMVSSGATFAADLEELKSSPKIVRVNRSGPETLSPS